MNSPRLSTSTTLTSPAMNACVLGRELMAVDAMCLAGVKGRSSIAPQIILSMSDRLQMGRINAVPHTAEMIKLKSGRYRANRYQVGIAMGQETVATNMEVAVPTWPTTSQPQPARLSLINLGPEAFNGIGAQVSATFILTEHGNQPSCVMRAAASNSASASLYPRTTSRKDYFG